MNRLKVMKTKIFETNSLFLSFVYLIPGVEMFDLTFLQLPPPGLR